MTTDWKKIRMALGMTQESFGEYLGVGRRAIQEIERRKRGQLPTGFVEEVARLTGLAIIRDESDVPIGLYFTEEDLKDLRNWKPRKLPPLSQIDEETIIANAMGLSSIFVLLCYAMADKGRLGKLLGDSRAFLGNLIEKERLEGQLRSVLAKSFERRVLDKEEPVIIPDIVKIAKSDAVKAGFLLLIHYARVDENEPWDILHRLYL
ncbi:MAG: helix-turn-helix transcriptional regulator, partial [Verrucomicrobiae bacterium]|nr:helix-turn-helix transcriptional regulator [Verrucomicrobiae bacterium]